MKSYISKQSEFYDKNPPFSPWPDVLVELGLSISYRPKEIYWKKLLDYLEIRPNSRLLDAGCGQGIFLKRIAKEYKIIGDGADVSVKSIGYANLRWRSERLKYIVSDIYRLNFKNNSFDFIISMDLFEHLTDKKKALSELARVLRPGGKILIHGVNKNYKYTLDWFWEKLGFDVFKRASHNPKYFIELNDFKKDLKSLNLNIVKTSFYDAFFTLGMDEFIITIALFFDKLGLGKNKIFGKVYLTFWSLISKIVYKTLLLLDYLWLKNGLSVGVSIVAKKYS